MREDDEVEWPQGEREVLSDCPSVPHLKGLPTRHNPVQLLEVLHHNHTTTPSIPPLSSCVVQPTSIRFLHSPLHSLHPTASCISLLFPRHVLASLSTHSEDSFCSRLGYPPQRGGGVRCGTSPHHD